MFRVGNKKVQPPTWLFAGEIECTERRRKGLSSQSSEVSVQRTQKSHQTAETATIAKKESLTFWKERVPIKESATTAENGERFKES